MANYRAITQYYNSSRIDLNHIIIPNQATTISNRSFIYPATSLLALSNMTQLRHLLPQNQVTRTEVDSTLESVRLYQQDRHDKSNLYSNLKPNYSSPNWTNSSAAFWNNVNSNYTPVKPSNSSDSSDSSEVFMTVEDSENEKILRFLSLEESNLRKLLINKTSQKFNLSFGPEALNRKLSRHLKYCDDLNPFSCEFCAIADRRNNEDTEIIELRILLNTFKLNPYELTDGIKKVLTWPWEKCTNNLSTIDGLTSFYLDDQKRKVKESFPNIVMDLSDSTSKNFCSGGPPVTPKFSNHDQIRNCNSCSQCYSQVLTLQPKSIDTKASEKKEEIFKSRQDNPTPTKTIPTVSKTSEDNQQSELEYLRNRMAEFICIGPLSNKWYMETFWTTERPRMPYTQNFVSTTTTPTTTTTQSESIWARERPSYIQNFTQVPRTSELSVDSNFGINQGMGDGHKANLSNERIIAQEKINEILLRRAQLKPRK